MFFIIVFYGLLILFFYKNRKKVKFQGKIIALYRTKLGLKLMDKVSNIIPRILAFIGYVGVVVGFAGMFFIFYILIKGTIKLILFPETVPALAPVLPGVKIPGLPVLSFWHWIIAIFVVAVVHEFSHGLLARVHKIPVKSSGFALFGPIIAAFVEPDEKKMQRKKKRAQLSVLSAGPFSNLLLGVLFLLIIGFVMTPLHDNFYEGNGIIVNQIIEDTPASNLDLEVPFIIKKLNGQDTSDIMKFLIVTSGIRPDDNVILETDKGKYEFVASVNPDNSSKGYMGVSNFKIDFKTRADYIGKSIVNIFSWFNMLIFWLFLINIGVGLFNLLPLGPVDGGRMFFLLALGIVKDKKKAHKIWKFVSWFCLLLIIINLMPYIMKLVMFLFKPFIILLG